ncbi:UDP-N-acetylglucosamine--N-acetylmuramyl-(pentapeptide) pyrophosphoryl-undecaprenol N-acetylglucosaminetransferase [Striga asiatica]|uniref:UDP-N-acetylglucosamine--N-acetylmuramyl-(Pentapeptide) pyrophosphoryl-undecaprenol N-acetylglucosaminetransferase n=1 Tax=Striga asiatica TaxID=4170 RepID=A0A5A7RA76_STRAF|nr:UDP-N-acetylglucosamine--N-acetylmuramyl-(pentapeptide) pyrophosphoryl-undecaprenol N-acetylglucosaminetransferase [Striga asiatica]
MVSMFPLANCLLEQQTNSPVAMQSAFATCPPWFSSWLHIPTSVPQIVLPALSDLHSLFPGVLLLPQLPISASEVLRQPEKKKNAYQIVSAQLQLGAYPASHEQPAFSAGVNCFDSQQRSRKKRDPEGVLKWTKPGKSLQKWYPYLQIRTASKIPEYRSCSKIAESRHTHGENLTTLIRRERKVLLFIRELVKIPERTRSQTNHSSTLANAECSTLAARVEPVALGKSDTSSSKDISPAVKQARVDKLRQCVSGINCLSTRVRVLVTSSFPAFTLRVDKASIRSCSAQPIMLAALFKSARSRRISSPNIQTSSYATEERVTNAVFALPNASSIQLAFKMSVPIPPPPPLSAAKYFTAILAVSVFPAPLSPLKLTKYINKLPKHLLKQSEANKTGLVQITKLQKIIHSIENVSIGRHHYVVDTKHEVSESTKSFKYNSSYSKRPYKHSPDVPDIPNKGYLYRYHAHHQYPTKCFSVPYDI